MNCPKCGGVLDLKDTNGTEVRTWECMRCGRVFTMKELSKKD